MDDSRSIQTNFLTKPEETYKINRIYSCYEGEAYHHGCGHKG